MTKILTVDEWLDKLRDKYKLPILYCPTCKLRFVNGALHKHPMVTEVIGEWKEPNEEQADNRMKR